MLSGGRQTTTHLFQQSVSCGMIGRASVRRARGRKSEGHLQGDNFLKLRRLSYIHTIGSLLNQFRNRSAFKLTNPSRISTRPVFKRIVAWRRSVWNIEINTVSTNLSGINANEIKHKHRAVMRQKLSGDGVNPPVGDAPKPATLRGFSSQVVRQVPHNGCG